MLDKEKAQAHSATMQTGAKILGGLLGALLGSRRPRRGSTMSSASRTYQQRADVKVAERKVDGLEEEIARLEEDLQEEVADLERDYDPFAMDLERESVKPYKKDIDINSVALLWLPYDERGEKLW
jgi:polyhydroxyalkanoate synthesis regulator phasin